MWRHDTAQGLAFLGGRDAGISETGKDKVSLYLSFSVAAASVWAPEALTRCFEYRFVFPRAYIYTQTHAHARKHARKPVAGATEGKASAAL